MDNRELYNDICQLIENHTMRINLKIENEVTKRIEALFDSYKLTHEKQWDMERKIHSLEKRIEELEERAS